MSAEPIDVRLKPRAPVRLLVVEDNPGFVELLRQSLQDSSFASFDCVPVSRLASAIAELGGTPIDAILLDVGLPDSQGVSTIATIQEAAPAVPIIVMTGNQDEKLFLEAVQRGVQGYLLKSEVTAELVGRTVCHAIERQRLLSALERAQADASFRATHDSLTGLPNRALFEDRIGQALATAERTGAGVAVLFVDLDRLKTVNDNLGHAAGDELLQQVASLLLRGVRRSDSVARLGGDEFAILLTNLKHPSDAEKVARKLVASFGRPVPVGSGTCVPWVSVGLATYPDDAKDPATLLAAADAAMYHAKQAGGGRYSVYQAGMHVPGHEHRDSADGVRRGLERGEFELEFEAQMDLASGRVVGAEALIGWRHPRFGRLADERCLALVGDLGMRSEVSDWGLAAACRAARAWSEQGAPHMGVAWNVSSSDLGACGYPDAVADALARTGLAPERLTLEIAASELVDMSAAVESTIAMLRRFGVRIALDDLGMDSIRRLREIEVDAVKLDASLLWGVPGSRVDDAMVVSLLKLAQELDIVAVVQGIETPAQLAFLQDRGGRLIVQGPCVAQRRDADALAQLFSDPGGLTLPDAPSAAASG